MEDSVYRQRILDHFHQPRHRGAVEKPSIEADLDNPLCGDRVHMALRLSGGNVAEAQWEGDGCAISQAAADILCERIYGKQLANVEALDDETFIRDLGIEVKPARRQCALLGWQCLRKAMDAGPRS